MAKLVSLHETWRACVQVDTTSGRTWTYITLFHLTVLSCDNPKDEDIVGKGENAGNLSIFRIFPTLPQTHVSSFVPFQFLVWKCLQC